MNSHLIAHGMDALIEKHILSLSATELSKLMIALRQQRRDKLVKRITRRVKNRNFIRLAAPAPPPVTPITPSAVITADDLLGLVMHNTLPQLEINFIINNVGAATDASYLLPRLTTIDSLKTLNYIKPLKPSAAEIEDRIAAIWEQPHTRIDYFIIAFLQQRGYLAIRNIDPASRFFIVLSKLPRDLQFRVLGLNRLINGKQPIIDRFIESVYRWL